MDLLEQALTTSPVSQADSILAAIVRIVGSLLRMVRREEGVEPLLTDLQLKIADKCSLILKKEDVSSKVCIVLYCIVMERGWDKRVCVVYYTSHIYV